jgi:hypothetical protein
MLGFIESRECLSSERTRLEWRHSGNKLQHIYRVLRDFGDLNFFLGALMLRGPWKPSLIHYSQLPVSSLTLP